MHKMLNQLLSDLVVEYHKLQHYHWYVKGPDFFPVHAQLESYYDGVREDIDAIAESLLQINHEPLSSLKDFLATAKIEAAKPGFVTSDEILAEVEKDFSYIYEQVRSLKKAADEANRYVTSMLMDDLIRKYAKSLWMLRQARMK